MTYLRFGGIPRGGRSEMWPWKWCEAGVSVFEADATADGYVIRLGHLIQIHDLVRVLKEHRPLYRVEGRVIGQGEASKEPLLADARIVEAVHPGAEITVSGAGICSVYVHALVAAWSKRRRAEDRTQRRTDERRTA